MKLYSQVETVRCLLIHLLQVTYIKAQHRVKLLCGFAKDEKSAHQEVYSQSVELLEHLVSQGVTHSKITETN